MHLLGHMCELTRDIVQLLPRLGSVSVDLALHSVEEGIDPGSLTDGVF